MKKKKLIRIIDEQEQVIERYQDRLDELERKWITKVEPTMPEVINYHLKESLGKEMEDAIINGVSINEQD